MTRAVCLRCEWAGTAPPSGGCPRCGIAVYRRDDRPERTRASASAAPPRRPAGRGQAAVLEAEIVAPPQISAPPPRTDDRERRARPPSRRWIPALAVVLVAAGIPLLPGRDAPAPSDEPDGAPPAPALRFLALPRGLSDRTADTPVRIAFSVAEPLPEDRGELHRLWRLDLPTGALTPGPIVSEVIAVRYAAPRTGRLAFLVRGGGLFVLDGFLSARPTWVDGGVASFDFTEDGALVYLGVERRTGPGGGGAEAVLRLGRLEHAESIPGAVGRRRVRNLDVGGAAVRGGDAFAWGIRRGRQVVVRWDGRRVQRVGVEDRGPALQGRAGPWAIGPEAQAVWLDGAPTDPLHIGLSAEAGLGVWAAEGTLTVADLRGRRTYVVRLPPRFPVPTGPVAAG